MDADWEDRIGDEAEIVRRGDPDNPWSGWLDLFWWMR